MDVLTVVLAAFQAMASFFLTDFVLVVGGRRLSLGWLALLIWVASMIVATLLKNYRGWDG